MSTLPLAWETASLSEVCTRIVDGSHNPPKASNSGLPMLSARNINDFQIVFDEYRLISESDFAAEHLRTNVASGDVLLTIVGTIGRTAVVPVGSRPFVLQRSVAVLKPRGIDARYIAYALQSPSCQQWLTDNAKGTAQKGIYLKSLGTTAIPIAPRPEQTRIVEKLEELLSDLDAGVAELKAAQKKLALYRQSLLKAAVEGALTADWRARRAARDEPLETGAALLARILTERRARWEARQLAKFKEQCKTPPKGWQAKYPEPVQPDTTNLSSLPAGWLWASLDMLGEIVSGVAKGSKQTPGISLREVPYLRVANVQRGFLDLSEIKKIMASERDIEELTLLNGDVLFNEGGDRDKLGRGWVWRDEVAQCIHQNHVFRMRPYLPEVLSEFVSHHGNTFGKSWFQQAGKQTTNLASINMGILRAFPVPVPPADEAREILERVSQEIDAIKLQEASIERGLRQATAQRKNLLKAAFSGQLVPQNPNDEPASTLLARIRAEREARSNSSPNRRTRKAAHA